jgi:hypothetical protein
MKDRLLYGTIGLLVGIVVMQWTMPSGQATVVTPPAGRVIAQTGNGGVLTDEGEVWNISQPQGPGTPYEWMHLVPSLPIPVDQVYSITDVALVDIAGNFWTVDGDQWVNVGQAPSGTVANDQSTWGKIKAKFREIGE